MYLMRRIELFLKRVNMAPTRFGKETVNDPRLISDMKNGRELSENTRKRVTDWLDSQEKRE